MSERSFFYGDYLFGKTNNVCLLVKVPRKKTVIAVQSPVFETSLLTKKFWRSFTGGQKETIQVRR
ncbi:MAG: hypothetical protein CSA34_02660 [Desulfobulbus propionicus]|nr:MAG: hypothetical protein CSA34_02660 [Desulfobulbus propionicus]